MSRRSSALYEFGIREIRVLPHNDDHTVATTDNVFSSEGPWDFSGASDLSSVPLYTQVDDGDLITRLVDLSDLPDPTAVTPAQLVVEIQRAAAMGYSTYDVRVTTGGDTRVTTGGDTRVLANPLDFFAVVDARVQVTAPSASYWIQVFGELAELAGFGHGFGLRWITCDTGKSFSPEKLDDGSSRYATKDGNGETTALVEFARNGGYRMRFVDSAADYSLIELVDEQGRTFMVETYQGVYPRGTNREGAPVKVVQEQYYNVSGRVLEPEKARSFSDRAYSFQATKGAGYAVAKNTEVITIAEYRALGLENY